MRISDIDEAFSMGSMPLITHEAYQSAYLPILEKSIKVADVRNNLELYCYSGKNYLLVKNGSIILGNMLLSPQEISGKQYLNVEVIFVDPSYRKSSATHWLLYSVKELVNYPIIADGAIFSDGLSLISSLQKHKYVNVSKINTKTGDIEKLDAPINDMDHAYIFESVNLGFGKDMFESDSLPFVWYPLFEDIE